jgi:tetratricopeptide (TPR) repeat protein
MKRAFFSLLLVGCASQPALHGLTGGEPTPLETRLANNPNDPEVNFELGENAERTGDNLRAEQYFLRAEALGTPADKVVPRIIRVLITAQRYDEALERCRRRLQQSPQDRATRYVEASLLQALEKPKDAERELLTLSNTKPDDAHAYLSLATLYRDGFADPVRARAMFTKFLTLAPEGDEATAVRYQMAELPPDPTQP